MSDNFRFEILREPELLAGYGGWTLEVYQDLLAIQQGHLTEAQFHEKYLETKAVLILDMTNFTESTIQFGPIVGFSRILDVQKVCLPVLQQSNATRIRTFADDITATFQDPHHALDASLEIHRRVSAFNTSKLASEHPAEACIGLGYGPLFRIGPDLAMGNQMNQASKLGEDTANGGETLLTEAFFQIVAERDDCLFEFRGEGNLGFPYFAAFAKGSTKQEG